MNHVHLIISDVSLRLYDSVDCLISTYKKWGDLVLTEHHQLTSIVLSAKNVDITMNPNESDNFLYEDEENEFDPQDFTSGGSQQGTQGQSQSGLGSQEVSSGSVCS